MAIPNQSQEIYRLAVGMFGASPGVFYFNELNGGLNSGITLVQYYNILLNDPAFSQGTFALTPAASNAAFVDAFLTRLLGPGTTFVTQAGRDFAQTFFTAQLNSGVSRGQMMLNAITALDNVNQADPNFAAAAARFDNEIAVAQNYTEVQSGSALDVSILQGTLSGVTNDPTTVQQAIANNQAGSGRQVDLTENQDSGGQFNGGAGNDLFSAPVKNVAGNQVDTLQSFDSLDGGGGTNTLDATLSLGNAPAPILKNIQNVLVRFAGADTLDLTNATGVTTISVQNSSAAGTVKAVGAASTLAVRNQVQTVTFASSTAATLNLVTDTVGINNSDPLVAKQTVIDIGGTAAPKAATIALTMNNSNVELKATNAGNVTTGTIAATGTNTLKLTDAATKVTTLTVTGTGSLDLSALTLTELKTLTADQAGGAIKVKVDDTAISVKTGAGADAVTYVGAAIAANAVVDLGAGNDSLTIAAASNKGAQVSGGTGTDTLKAADGLFIDANATNIYTGFETLDVSKGTGDYTMTRLPTINAVTLSAALTGDVKILDAAAGTTLAVTASKADVVTTKNLTYALKDATGNSDTLALSLTGTDGNNDGVADGKITVTKLTANGIENISVASQINSIDNTLKNTDYTHTITSFDADAVKALTITGNANLTITAFTGTTLTKIDAAAATGKISVDASTQGQSVLFLGGSANDTYKGTAFGDTINANKGGDAITLGAAAGGVDTIIQGAGDSQLTATANAFDVITGFGTAAGGGPLDIVDLGSFGFTGQQSSALANKGVLPASAINGSTLTQANWFVQGVARGVAVGTVGADTYVYVDANKDGNFDASVDLFFELAGVTDVTLANFGF
jgi:hypothetical protein